MDTDSMRRSYIFWRVSLVGVGLLLLLFFEDENFRSFWIWWGCVTSVWSVHGMGGDAPNVAPFEKR